MLFVNLHLQDVNIEMSLVMFSVFLNHSVNLKGFPNESESNCLGKTRRHRKQNSLNSLNPQHLNPYGFSL